MVGIAQLVRASDCGSECRRFEAVYSPEKKNKEGFKSLSFLQAGEELVDSVVFREMLLEVFLALLKVSLLPIDLIDFNLEFGGFLPFCRSLAGDGDFIDTDNRFLSSELGFKSVHLKPLQGQV